MECKATFDEKHKVGYIKLNGNEVDKTEEMTIKGNIDYDKKGNIVGVQILLHECCECYTEDDIDEIVRERASEYHENMRDAYD